MKKENPRTKLVIAFIITVAGAINLILSAGFMIQELKQITQVLGFLSLLSGTVYIMQNLFYKEVDF